MTDGSSRASLLFILLLVAVTLGVYGRSIGGEFVWDDRYLVLEDERVQDRYRVGEIFSRPFAHTGRAGRLEAYYRPLVTLSYFANYQLSGADPSSYHLLNIALHVLICLLIWRLLHPLFEKPIHAMALALLFAVHPAHVPTVGWIAGRVDLVCGALLLMALLMYVRARTGAWHVTAKWASLPVLFLALAAKELAFLFPCAVLLFDLHRDGWRPGRTFRSLDWRYYLACFGVMAAFFALRQQILQSSEEGLSLADLWQRLPDVVLVLALYLRIIFVPFGLQGFYFSEALGGWLDVVVLALTLAVFGWALWRRNGLVLLGMFWLLGSLLPVLDIVVYDSVCLYIAADHRSYLPSLGGLLVVAGLALPLVRRLPSAVPRWLPMGILGTILIAFALETVRNSDRWLSERALFRSLAAGAPSDATFLLLGFAAFERGELAEAEDAFRNGLACDPNAWRHHFGLGEVAIARTDYQAAREHLAAAAAIEGAFTDVFNDLGNLYKLEEDHPNAQAAYLRALELAPRNFNAMFNLAQSYGLAGDTAQATAWARRFISEAPPGYETQKRQLAGQLGLR